MRRAARTDADHAAIVTALRKCGAQVLELHQVGGGCPDLLVQTTRTMVLMEIKTARGKLTADQKRFHAVWLDVQIVRSVEEALEAIGIK